MTHLISDCCDLVEYQWQWKFSILPKTECEWIEFDNVEKWCLIIDIEFNDGRMSCLDIIYVRKSIQI